VHTRDAFERAPQLPTWSASSLHIAAWHGDPELVLSLVQSSADRESTRAAGNQNVRLFSHVIASVTSIPATGSIP